MNQNYTPLQQQLAEDTTLLNLHLALTQKMLSDKTLTKTQRENVEFAYQQALEVLLNIRLPKSHHANRKNPPRAKM